VIVRIFATAESWRIALAKMLPARIAPICPAMCRVSASSEYRQKRDHVGGVAADHRLWALRQTSSVLPIQHATEYSESPNGSLRTGPRRAVSHALEPIAAYAADSQFPYRMAKTFWSTFHAEYTKSERKLL
jgi:hypothetical protein